MSWKNIIGHEVAIRLLKGQLSQGRLAQSYLFAGQRGIGKRLLTMELAKALVCRSARDGESCDACEPCRQVSQGTCTDVRVVSPESETGQVGIDQIRALIRWMALTPYGEGAKVGILEEADQLTEQAAHASLKLLEEPHARGIVILIASSLHGVPATLLSRCHLVRCVPQGMERVAAALIAQEKVPADVAHLLAALCGGRMGFALELFRGSGLADKNAALDELTTAWRRKNPEVPSASASREAIQESLEWLAAWWRDILILSLRGDPSWLIHQDRLKDLKKESVGVEELLGRIEQTYRVREAIQRNASPRIALAALLTQ